MFLMIFIMMVKFGFFRFILFGGCLIIFAMVLIIFVLCSVLFD